MLKKYLVLCMLLLIGSMTLLQAQVPGDVDDNGTVDIVDLFVLVQYMIGLQPTINLGAADVNNDGQISLADVLCIRHLYFHGIILTPGVSDTSPGVGTISLKTEPYQPYLPDQEFYVKVLLDTGIQSLGAVDLTINYNPAVLEYMAIVFPSNFTQLSYDGSGGYVRLRGFITPFVEPSAEKHLATIKFKQRDPGPVYHPWQITITELIDSTTAVIGTPAAAPHTSRIIDGLFGDVNLDLAVNIVDALLIARSYVGLSQLACEDRVADVDNNEQVDILDALMVARKYVDLIDKFPVEEYEPEPIADL